MEREVVYAPLDKGLEHTYSRGDCLSVVKTPEYHRVSSIRESGNEIYVGTSTGLHRARNLRELKSGNKMTISRKFLDRHMRKQVHINIQDIQTLPDGKVIIAGGYHRTGIYDLQGKSFLRNSDFNIEGLARVLGVTELHIAGISSIIPPIESDPNWYLHARTSSCDELVYCFDPEGKIKPSAVAVLQETWHPKGEITQTTRNTRYGFLTTACGWDLKLNNKELWPAYSRTGFEGFINRFEVVNQDPLSIVIAGKLNDENFQNNIFYLTIDGSPVPKVTEERILVAKLAPRGKESRVEGLDLISNEENHDWLLRHSKKMR